MAKKVVCTACGQAHMQPTADLRADDNNRLVDWVCLNSECNHTEKMQLPAPAAE
jgi:hypothetical protein